MKKESPSRANPPNLFKLPHHRGQDGSRSRSTASPSRPALVRAGYLWLRPQGTGCARQRWRKINLQAWAASACSGMTGQAKMNRGCTVGTGGKGSLTKKIFVVSQPLRPSCRILCRLARPRAFDARPRGRHRHRSDMPSYVNPGILPSERVEQAAQPAAGSAGPSRLPMRPKAGEVGVPCRRLRPARHMDRCARQLNGWPLL